jgi:hypothetical protein
LRYTAVLALKNAFVQSTPPTRTHTSVCMPKGRAPNRPPCDPGTKCAVRGSGMRGRGRQGSLVKVVYVPPHHAPHNEALASHHHP